MPQAIPGGWVLEVPEEYVWYAPENGLELRTRQRVDYLVVRPGSRNSDPVRRVIDQRVLRRFCALHRRPRFAVLAFAKRFGFLSEGALDWRWPSGEKASGERLQAWNNLSSELAELTTKIQLADDLGRSHPAAGTATRLAGFYLAPSTPTPALVNRARAEVAAEVAKHVGGVEVKLPADGRLMPSLDVQGTRSPLRDLLWWAVYRQLRGPSRTSCPWCGTTFERGRRDQNYCCTDHQVAAWKDARRAATAAATPEAASSR